MFTKLGHTPGKVHTFTSEIDFLPQDDWVLKYKSTEVYTAWKELVDSEIDNGQHPDVIALYEEWIEDQGVTHTIADE